MRVLLTGASGFVGIHTLAALGKDGHTVRAFVRSATKLAQALEPLGVEAHEVIEGDCTDGTIVREAVEGCDALIHAANVFTYSTRYEAEMERVNVGGTEAVLAAAVDAGCDPVVHVSTYLISLPCAGPVGNDPPLGPPGGHPYIDSKKRAEAVARRFQANGHPVVTTYPGSVWGPHDPGSGEMVRAARLFLGSPVTFGLEGHLGIVDVGWLGKLHTRLIQRGQGPRRIMCGGTTLPYNEVARRLFRAARRRPPLFLPTPYALSSAVGRAAQAISRATGIEVLVHAEGAWLVKKWQPTDDSLARALAGDPPPVDETFGSAVAAMAAAGQLGGRHVGRSLRPVVSSVE